MMIKVSEATGAGLMHIGNSLQNMTQQSRSYAHNLEK